MVGEKEKKDRKKTRSSRMKEGGFRLPKEMVEDYKHMHPLKYSMIFTCDWCKREIRKKYKLPESFEGVKSEIKEKLGFSIGVVRMRLEYAEKQVERCDGDKFIRLIRDTSELLAYLSRESISYRERGIITKEQAEDFKEMVFELSDERDRLIDHFDTKCRCEKR